MRRRSSNTTAPRSLDPIDQRLEADRVEQVERVQRPWQFGVHDRL